MYFLVKTLVTALVIAAVSEISRRFSFVAALLISLPITSILAMCWIYGETHDTQKITAMSYDIFWLVLPSLAFFLILPALLKMDVKFVPAMLLSCGAMAAFYGLATILFNRMAS